MCFVEKTFRDEPDQHETSEVHVWLVCLSQLLLVSSSRNLQENHEILVALDSNSGLLCLSTPLSLILNSLATIKPRARLLLRPGQGDCEDQ